MLQIFLLLVNRQFKDFAPLALSVDPWEFSQCCNNQEQFLLLQDDGKARSVNNNKVNKLQSVDTNVHTLPLYKDSTQKDVIFYSYETVAKGTRGRVILHCPSETK